MKTRFRNIATRLIAASFLAVATVAGVEQKTLAAELPVDPATHAKHVAAGTHPAPADATKGDPALSQQLSELQAKIAQLEAALAKNAPPAPAASAPAASAMPGMATPATPMAGMKSAAPGAKTATTGMGGMSPPRETANKMAMMKKMIGMMDKMMSMDDGAMPAGAPMAGGADMGMGMMKSKTGGSGGGAMPTGAPAPGMSDGSAGTAMEKKEMAEMMGMGAMSSGVAGTMPQSVLPGFPGASHLYHIGATDFFLDHPQHITLTTEQQTALNKAKEQALLAKGTADRAVAQAEQDLWTLTASDQPDATKIDAKVREIEKLQGDQRLDFIRAVGEAANLLTDEQRQSLLGLKPAQPQGMPAMPVAPAAGMGDM